MTPGPLYLRVHKKTSINTLEGRIINERVGINYYARNSKQLQNMQVPIRSLKIAYMHARILNICVKFKRYIPIHRKINTYYSRSFKKSF